MATGRRRSRSRTKRRRKSQSAAPPDWASNPITAWLHALAAMGGERWDVATVALQRFLEMAANPHRPEGHFALGIDSDLSMPYGDPMQGTLIYLNQHPQPGILVGTLGLMVK